MPLDGENDDDGGRYPNERAGVAIDEDLVDHVPHHPGAQCGAPREHEHEKERYEVAREISPPVLTQYPGQEPEDGALGDELRYQGFDRQGAAL